MYFDPPHRVKHVRNNFAKTLQFDTKEKSTMLMEDPEKTEVTTKSVTALMENEQEMEGADCLRK